MTLSWRAEYQDGRELRGSGGAYREASKHDCRRDSDAGKNREGRGGKMSTGKKVRESNACHSIILSGWV